MDSFTTSRWFSFSLTATNHKKGLLKFKKMSIGEKQGCSLLQNDIFAMMTDLRHSFKTNEFFIKKVLLSFAALEKKNKGIVHSTISL